MKTNSEWIEYYRFHPSEFEAFIKLAEDLDWQVTRYNRENALLVAENARLRAHIIKSDDFVEKYGEFPISCVYMAAELLDERRALLETK